MTLSPSRQRPEVAPPVIPWPTFEADFFARWEQGEHCLFSGPNKSGKTALCRVLARRRRMVCVLGTKPRDSALDAYLQEGYVRIDHWPPNASDWRRNGRRDDDSARFILWPKITTRDDLTKYQPIFAGALDDMYVQGYWTIVADEGLWLSTKLKLNEQLDGIAFSGRSNDLTLMILVQRPRGIPINCWTNALHAFLWQMGNTDDIRELASLGRNTRRSVQDAVSSLVGHQFLYLPCHAAGGTWAISQVDPRWL